MFDSRYFDGVDAQALINRIKFYNRQISKHPEYKQKLENKISETKELIFEAVMSSDGDDVLKQIIVPETKHSYSEYIEYRKKLYED